MNKTQLNRQLNFLLVDLGKVDKRMDNLAKKLDIPKNTEIKNILKQIQQLIEIGESKC